MNQTFFLAANSGNGFCSLYDSFPGPGCFLHVIKGGPGTGKSGYMKRLRSEAAARGLDTVSILCSGDPDSLDALAIPALGQAWVDGTAPHIREPGLLGADGDYVNLGRFCRLPLSEHDRARAEELNRAYKALYAKAYRLLAAAAALEEGEELADGAVDREDGARVAEALAALPERSCPACVVEKRFLSAISCRGELFLQGTVDELCKQKILLRSASALEKAAGEAGRKTGRVIVCPQPLRPEQTEAVLMPELSPAFLRAPAAVRVPEGERLSRGALELAVRRLGEAKRLHDKLEEVYRPYMDFHALTAFAEETVVRLFE